MINKENNKQKEDKHKKKDNRRDNPGTTPAQQKHKKMQCRNLDEHPIEMITCQM